MKLTWGLVVGHLVALTFGLAGILIALPNPQMWANSPLGVQTFTFGMEYAGSLHILFGAAAMLAFGGWRIGWRKTLIFFVASVTISLTSELVGTATGWPFGNYAYTEGLGPKVLGRVPYTIPLSWFYMGFASYVLAAAILDRFTPRARPWAAVALGSWLLLAWDVVLDPAMAHESLPIKFWVWSETGIFFGMPLKNLVAWFATGLVYIGVGRLLWREDLRQPGTMIWVPLVTYVANCVFAAFLSASVGLWQPIPLAAVVALAPVAVLALLARRPAERQPSSPLKATGIAGS